MHNYQNLSTTEVNKILSDIQNFDQEELRRLYGIQYIDGVITDLITGETFTDINSWIVVYTQDDWDEFEESIHKSNKYDDY